MISISIEDTIIRNKTRFLCLISMLLILPLPLAAEIIYLQEYDRYIAGRHDFEIYGLEQTEDHTVRTYVCPEEASSCFLDQKNNTSEILTVLSEEDTEIRAWRDNVDIFITGRYKGREINKEVGIDELPWYQSLSYSLSSFSLSNEEKRVFWYLRLDNLEPVKLQAIRKEIEILEINGIPVETRKVKVSLTGLMTSFWHSYYWFRTDNGFFAQYRGVNGPPGTPETFIRIKGE